MEENIVFTNENNIQYLYVQPILLQKQVCIAERHGWEHQSRIRYRFKEPREHRMPAEQDLVNGVMIWKKGKVIMYVGGYEDYYKEKNGKRIIKCCGTCNPFPCQRDLYMKYNN